VAGLGSLAASVILAIAYFVYVPLRGDGAWYLYPSYAMSQGGDPSENIPGADRSDPPPNRMVTIFPWENRSNLTVLINSAWFKIVAPSWQSIRAFGAVQLLVLIALIGFATKLLTRNLTLSLFSMCLVAADARVIQEALSDARPELMIAICAVTILAFLVKAFDTSMGRYFVGAGIFAAALPLLHSTAVMAISFILFFVATFILLSRNSGRAVSLVPVAAIMLIFVTVFFLRQSILDVIIPTRVPEALEISYRHNLVQELSKIVHAGFGAKLGMEFNRWSEYFFIGNSGHFIFFVATLAIAGISFARRKGDIQTDLAFSLIGGFFGAVVTMLCLDSHRMNEHALVVSVLGYLACVAVLGMATRNRVLSDSRAYTLCLAVLLLACALNAGHSYKIYSNYGAFNVSNSSIQKAILSVIPANGDVEVIGPTEIWPYLTPRKQPLLLIDDYRLIFSRFQAPIDVETNDDFSKAQYLIIDKDYFTTYSWSAGLSMLRAKGLIATVRKLGDCDRASDCFEMYKFTGLRKHIAD
jgi:hypothetical protein